MESTRLTIQVVDDIRDNLITLKAVIGDAFPGAEVLTAQSGAEGIELARERDPDVILLDIVMPGMDGFQVCRRLKEDERLRRIPVVFLTARLTDRESRIRALEIGAEAFLSKPVEETELVAQIRAMIKIKAAAVAQQRERERLSTMVAERTGKLHRQLAEQHKVEEALRRSEERYRTLMESVPAVIYRFSTKRGGLFYSPQVETVFGHPLGMFHDNPMLWRDSIHPDDLPAVMAVISSGGTGDGEGFDIEYRVRSRAGEWVWLNDRSVRRVRIGDEVIIDGIAQDISARKRAERERLLLERQFQQAQKLESLGVLAGGIAHDFNNILTIIQGHCYLARQATCPDGGRDGHIQEIEEAAGRAAQLCRQMLAYAGKGTLSQSRLDLALLLKGVVRMLRAAIPKNVAIDLELNADRPQITGDPAQVQQVAMNLIINAADAIGDRQGRIRVALGGREVVGDRPENDFFGRAVNPGSYLCLEVGDNGCGMDDETQRRIFEPFFTTKFAGRGLGMSAVMGIIGSHRGALQLKSSPGVGTDFRILFPLVHSRTGADVSMASVPTPPAGVGTILLVDDEDALRGVATSLLEGMGFSVITAADGCQALDVFSGRMELIDLVLLDVIMPEMGGKELFRELRRLAPELPILICSGCGLEEFARDIDGDPHAASVQKPYQPDHLGQVVMGMLGGGRGAAARRVPPVSARGGGDVGEQDRAVGQHLPMKGGAVPL